MSVQLDHSHILAETEDPRNFQVFMLLSSQFIAFNKIQVAIQSVKRLIFIEWIMTDCKVSCLGSKKGAEIFF